MTPLEEYFTKGSSLVMDYNGKPYPVEFISFIVCTCIVFWSVRNTLPVCEHFTVNPLTRNLKYSI